MALGNEENEMRRFLHGTANTSSGAKFAREDVIKDKPGSTVIIGYCGGYFLDIIMPIVKPKPHLRLVS